MCAAGSGGGPGRTRRPRRGRPNGGRPSPRAWLTNLGVPMPWPRKLALLARNASLRVLRLQDCCGHPGEPGC